MGKGGPVILVKYTYEDVRQTRYRKEKRNKTKETSTSSKSISLLLQTGKASFDDFCGEVALRRETTRPLAIVRFNPMGEKYPPN